MPGNAGRPKGASNRVTQSLRQQVERLLADNYEQVVNDLKKLSPKDRTDVWLRLLEYSLPKLSRTEAVEAEKPRPDLSRLTHEEKKDLVRLLTKAKTD